MDYGLENARFQWEEGERRLRDTEGAERLRLESAAEAVLEELRRRLGSSFTVEELAGFYGDDVDWASVIARERGAGTSSAWVVDAAFAAYARAASDFAGGRHRAGFSGRD